MNRSVILGYARTPFCKLGGALSKHTAVELGAAAIRGAIAGTGVQPLEIDEVIMGMVIQAGAGQVPARQAAVSAGIPITVPAETINKVCGSGMRSITIADQMLRAGDAHVIVAGGMESMSNAPYLVAGARFGLRMGDVPFIDAMMNDGLRCPIFGVPMAVHGSTVAAEYQISREEQDAYALQSHMRALAAKQAGKFDDEIVPALPAKGSEQGAKQTYIREDEGIRPDTSLAKLASLKPVYHEYGTITAGNAPGVNDGAAAVVIASENHAKVRGWKPIATILGHVQVALEAPYIAAAPAVAILKLLNRTGYSIEQIDLLEVNEAFAAVVLTSQKMVGWHPDKVNVNGGAIALGHPIGASGARIVGSLIRELIRRGGGVGIAAICSGTAQGDAILVQV